LGFFGQYFPEIVPPPNITVMRKLLMTPKVQVSVNQFYLAVLPTTMPSKLLTCRGHHHYHLPLL